LFHFLFVPAPSSVVQIGGVVLIFIEWYKLRFCRMTHLWLGLFLKQS
jgi:hypothetical protein